MLCLDSRPRSHFGWAAANGSPNRCAAQMPESSVAGLPRSRVNLDRTAGPEPGDKPARTPLETA